MFEIANKHLLSVRSYKDCIRRLNKLQGCTLPLDDPSKRLTAFKERLFRLGHRAQDLDKLNIIHITGTKGKGSTCLFSQQILLSIDNIKVGMFTSPHVLEVRERIRINGKPISYEKFTDGFNYCASKLDKQLEKIGYFQFLTLLGFHLMIEERVDALVLEVGIGGLYDFTNIIEVPVVCGITKIEYDHQSVLGNSLEEITHNKAGIIKKNVECVTIKNQREVVFNEIAKKAKKEKITLSIAKEYFENSKIGVEGDHQYQNADLAMSLCKVWSQKVRKKEINKEQQQEILENLKNVNFIGRSYKYFHMNIEWCLDGAHTEDSLNMCLKWFNKTKSNTRQSNRQKPTVLLMGVANGRNYEEFVKIMFFNQKKTNLFDKVVFVPNLLDEDNEGKSMDESSDLYVHPRIKKLIDKNVHHKMAEYWNLLNQKNPTAVNSTANDSLKQSIDIVLKTNPGLVLVTGSLHLVSSVLTLLDHPIE